MDIQISRYPRDTAEGATYMVEALVWSLWRKGRLATVASWGRSKSLAWSNGKEEGANQVGSVAS